MVVSQFRRFFNMLMGRRAQVTVLPSPKLEKDINEGIDRFSDWVPKTVKKGWAATYFDEGTKEWVVNRWFSKKRQIPRQASYITTARMYVYRS